VVEPPSMTKGRRPGRPDRRPKNAPASADESPSGLPSALTWWWISLRCAWCGAVHLHRVRREQDAGGVRRTGCGRRVFVKIRTFYRGQTNLRTVA
jgi:DNA-directed RNA polymerase subunit RPC12/RpoP